MKSNQAFGATRAIAVTHARTIALVASVPAILTISGCTAMLTPLGAENYDCNRKENPASPYCHSFRSVANATNSDIPDSRYDTAVRISDVDRLAGIAPPAAEVSHDATPPAAATTFQGAQQLRPEHTQGAIVGLGVQHEGTPVRVAPLVQRTWVKRHVEQGDRLVGSTYLYTEVTRAHWQGYAESSGAAGAARDVVRPHLPADDDLAAVRAATNTVNKTATGLLGQVKSSLSQPGVAAPSGTVVAPPIDGASMPQ